MISCIRKNVCQSALKIDPGSALNFDPACDDGSGAMVMRFDGSGPVLEAPALVAGLDDVTVMGQPVQERGCHLPDPPAGSNRVAGQPTDWTEASFGSGGSRDSHARGATIPAQAGETDHARIPPPRAKAL